MNQVKLALLACVAAVSVSAGTVNLNTGTAGWQVVQTSGTNNGPGIGNSGSAVILTGDLPFAANLPGFEAFAWANPFSGAAWIGQLATDGQFTNGGSITCGSPCGATAGLYSYSFSFDASLGGSMILSGFTADNFVQSLSVVQANNGTLYTYTCTPGGGCPYAAGDLVATSTLTLAAVSGGVVTISATVQNLDGPGRNPSGFIASGSATLNDASPVPEPSTFALLGITGVALLIRRRG